MVNAFCKTADFKQTENLEDGRIIVRFNVRTDGGLTEYTEEIVDNDADAVKKLIKYAIGVYDTSSDVNGFTIKHGDATIDYWLPAEKRVQLKTGAEAVKEQGGSTYTLDLRDKGVSLTVDVDTLLSMLSKLEDYAVKCYNVTSQHLLAVDALEDVDAILGYGYQEGYPEKLSFEM